MVGLEGGRINIVPVDFVVDVLDILSKAAHGLRMSLFINARY